MKNWIKKIKDKKQENYRKRRLKELLTSLELSLGLSISFKPRDKEKVKKFLNDFNEKRASLEQDHLIKPYEPERSLMDSKLTKKAFKLLGRDFKKENFKIKEKEATSMSWSSLSNISLQDYDEELKNVENYLKELQKEKPKGLKFETSMNVSFNPPEDFTKEDIKLLEEEGYGHPLLATFEEIDKELKKTE